MINLDYLVRVNCITYNHVDFIEDALNGFCIQETRFPFVCVIIDDKSIDGEYDVIFKYLQDHFEINNSSISSFNETSDYYQVFSRHITNKNCFFLVYFLKYNHYQAKVSKNKYFNEINAKYVAICEGDDYWISPYKLQMQVSFLESHPDYMMSCSRTGLYSVKQKRMIGENYCYRHSKRVSIKDTIYRGGLFISTCSIVYRSEVDYNKPDYWTNCSVGDYPLQIACVLKGNVWYSNVLMSVYRIDNPLSWMGTQNWSKGSADPKRMRVLISQINMFRGFAQDFPFYLRLFNNKIADLINSNIPGRNESNEVVNIHLKVFANEIDNFNLWWRIDLLLRKCRIPFFRGIYNMTIMRRYNAKNHYYYLKCR